MAIRDARITAVQLSVDGLQLWGFIYTVMPDRAYEQ
jgi:hypothetical protein